MEKYCDKEAGFECEDCPEYVDNGDKVWKGGICKKGLFRKSNVKKPEFHSSTRNEGYHCASGSKAWGDEWRRRP